MTAPTAVVGVAEKGILDLEISTQSLGGHASTPVRAVPRLGWRARSCASTPTRSRRTCPSRRSR
ncbi:hypothetical protein NKG05_07855 [Oerskovia sp. M15]